MIDNILLGLTNVILPANLLAIVVGTVLGLFVGAMPGLSATMAIALLLPLTFGMDAATGISMLASLYLAAMYGGSIAAILIRTPGTPAAAATVVDGYPMAMAGKAGQALGVSLTASFIGGTLSAFALMTIAPTLGLLVLEFGPVEIFAVAVLGITIIASLSQGSTIRGLFAGVFGLLISEVGMDIVTGTPRFTYGVINLFDGVPFTVALIGLFSVPQAIRLIQSDDGLGGLVSKVTDRMLPTMKEFRRLLPNIVRSSGIGIITGLVPGAGGDTACWFAYNEAKRFSKFKEKFGTGISDGIAAPEAANNAVVGGALVPTIALGIPGSSSTAVLMGALMVHGILPGPNLMTEHADVTYTLIWAVLFANFALLVVGLAFTRVSVYVTQVPNKIIAPIIIVLCIIGSFAINNSVFDVGLMMIFGVIGYIFDRLKIPTAPMVLGLILGSMLDNSLHQSLLISDGSFMIFVDSPISAGLLAIALWSIIQNTPAGKHISGAIIRVFKRKRTD